MLPSRSCFSQRVKQFESWAVVQDQTKQLEGGAICDLRVSACTCGDNVLGLF